MPNVCVKEYGSFIIPWSLRLVVCCVISGDYGLDVLSFPLFSGQESQLIAGVAFKKTFSYAGFEMQPKRYENPKIALLNVELELKAEKDNAEVRVKSVEVRSQRSELDFKSPFFCLSFL